MKLLKHIINIALVASTLDACGLRIITLVQSKAQFIRNIIAASKKIQSWHTNTRTFHSRFLDRPFISAAPSFAGIQSGMIDHKQDDGDLLSILEEER